MTVDSRTRAEYQAVPLRRPGRWVAAVVILVLLALFLYGAATNDAYDWATYRKYIFDQRICKRRVGHAPADRLVDDARRSCSA